MAEVSKSKQFPFSKESVNLALDDLTNEAQALFQVLDDASSTIRDLEKRLNELKANFPFTYPLREDKSSVINPLEERHLNRKFELDPTHLGYCSRYCQKLCFGL